MLMIGDSLNRHTLTDLNSLATQNNWSRWSTLDTTQTDWLAFHKTPAAVRLQNLEVVR